MGQQYVRDICMVPKPNKLVVDVWCDINGVPAYRTEADKFLDARKKFSAEEYPYRTTLILLGEAEKAQYNKDFKPEDEVWDIVECSVKYCADGRMIEPNAMIPALLEPITTLTLLHLVPVSEEEVIQLVGQRPGEEPEVQQPPEAEAAGSTAAGRAKHNWWQRLEASRKSDMAKTPSPVNPR